MADIFLSYANRDLNRIQRLVTVLEQQGWSVWWDSKIRIGKSFHQVIEEEITNAKCIVVLWSNESVRSDWVKSEADEGKRRHILAPVLIDNVVIPLGFRNIESSKLYDWNGDSQHPELKLLLQAIGDIIGQQPKETDFVERVEQSRPSKSFSLDFAKNRIWIATISVVLLASLFGIVRHLINSKSTPPTTNANVSPTPNISPIPSTGQVVGIDVFRFTRVDWTRVNKNFVSFAMIKATQGTEMKDPEFENNWEGAKRAGIIRGAFHFFSHDKDGAAQANFFLSTVRLEDGDLAPVLDLEDDPNASEVDNVTLVNRVRTWLSLVQRVTGRKPIIYTGVSFWNEHMTDEFGDYPLWVASYDSPSPRLIPRGWRTWNFWQYSDQTTLEGIDGPVNTTLFNGSYQDLQNFIRAR